VRFQETGTLRRMRGLAADAGQMARADSYYFTILKK
jgi:hypothetical protein